MPLFTVEVLVLVPAHHSDDQVLIDPLLILEVPIDFIQVANALVSLRPPLSELLLEHGRLLFKGILLFHDHLLNFHCDLAMSGLLPSVEVAGEPSHVEVLLCVLDDSVSVLLKEGVVFPEFKCPCL